jgi:ABC-type phosphate transport system permease subunit
VCVTAVTLALVCVYIPSLTLVVFIVINIVMVRGSNLWRFLTKETSAIRKKTVVFKWIVGSLERG